MNQQEIINTIALTRLGYFSLASMLRLYKEVGSATEIMAHRQDIRAIHLSNGQGRSRLDLEDVRLHAVAQVSFLGQGAVVAEV